MANRTTIAFLVFAAVVGGLGYYIFGTSSGGIAYFSGQAIGIFVILFLIVGGIARARKKPVRTDIVFALAAVFLLFTNREEIASTYDAKRFQADVRAAGQGNFQQAIQELTTNIASAVRSMQEIATQTNTEVQKLFEAISDPALDGPLAPDKVVNPAALNAASAAAAEKLDLVSNITPRVDDLLEKEKARITEIAKRLPENMRKNLADGFAKTRSVERAFVEQRVDIYRRLMTVMQSVTEFLLARQGTYSPNDKGLLIFQSRADVDEYNRLFGTLQQTIADETKLDAEIAAFSENCIAEGWQKIAGSND